MRRWMVMVACGGCSGAPIDRSADARLFPQLLAEVEAQPADAARICGRLTHPDVRGDCVLHGVERLAKRDPDAAAALCGGLSGLGADECFFQVAERSEEVARCAAAGRFETDCRMHAWSMRVPDLAAADASGEEWARAIAEAALELGFDAADDRPWIAAARHVLGRDFPLDRALCEAWPAGAAEACQMAGLGLFHDRINHVRDARKWDCSDSPPKLLSFVPSDAGLTSVWAERRGEICP